MANAVKEYQSMEVRMVCNCNCSFVLLFQFLCFETSRVSLQQPRCSVMI